MKLIPLILCLIVPVWMWYLGKKYRNGNVPFGKEKGIRYRSKRASASEQAWVFANDLYFNISRHAIDMAERMKDLFISKGYKLFIDSPTNQQFVILGDSQMEKLKEKVAFSFWEKTDESHTVVRFATSWSTTEADLRYLEEVI